jgi:hypothetical protein
MTGLLPDNTRIDWNSLSELNSAELLPFLNEAYKELRIGSQIAKSFVSVESIQKIGSLVDKEEPDVAKVAADVVSCAWALLDAQDRNFLISRFVQNFRSDSDEMKYLKINLVKTEKNQISRRFLLDSIKDKNVGLKGLELFKFNFGSDPDNSATSQELDELYSQTDDDVIRLRIIELAGSGNNIQNQKWGSKKIIQFNSKFKIRPAAAC